MSNINCMMECKVYIVDIDYWEKDATLLVGDQKYFFQFEGDEPTVEDAITYLVNDFSTKVN